MGRPTIENHKANKADFKLPVNLTGPRPVPPVIRYGLFTWSLPPLVPGVLRLINIKCTRCKYERNQQWPILSTNLIRHWISHHNEAYLEIKERWAAGTNSDTTGSTPSVSENRISGPALDTLDTFSRESGVLSCKRRKVEASHSIFDPEVFHSLMLKYLMANNLPLCHINSPSLAELLSYARRCQEGELPLQSQGLIRADLYKVYEDSVKNLKSRLAAHEGRFALSLNVWRSSHTYDFLAITLHFHNNDLELERYVIGFEAFEKATSDSGDVMYEHLDRVLSEYDINDRLVSITRDNSAPFDRVMELFKQSSRNLFTADIRCAEDVLNLATNAFLSCTYFKSGSLGLSSESFEEKHSQPQKPHDQIDCVHQTVSTMIHGVHNNIGLKTKFEELVKARNENEGNTSGPDSLLQYDETSWSTVYRMLKRFLHFKQEILELLEFMGSQSQAERNSLQLKTLDIDENTWTYLSHICEILDILYKPTMELQHDKRATSQMIVPYISTVLHQIDALEPKILANTNPSLALGLQEVRKILLKYYPVRDADIERNKHLYLATMLDPHFKKGVFTNINSPSSVAASGEEYFAEVFHRYRLDSNTLESNKESGQTTKLASKQPAEGINEIFYDESQILKAELDPESEIQRYFAQERVSIDCSTREYYMAQRTNFPTIYRMAKDYRSIMATSALSSSLFSKVKYIVTDSERLLPDTIRMLLILKSRGIVTDEVSSMTDSQRDYDAVEVNNSEELQRPDTNDMQDIDKVDRVM